MALLEQLNKLTAQNIFLDENTGGKGRYFKSRFLQAGLVKYSFGVCILAKETIDKFVDGFVGCPVIINHKDVTNESAKDDRVGVISRVWYDEKDGWFWCEGVIFDEEAISLIESGYNVSCQYEITEYSNNTTKALHNGNPYDKVILNGKPEHLAIVKTPRYESAMIAVNALDLTAENEELTADNGFITIDGGTENERVIWVPFEVLSNKAAKMIREIADNYKEGDETEYDFSHTRVKLSEEQQKYIKDTVKEIQSKYKFKGVAQINISSELNRGSLGVCAAPNNCSVVSLSPQLYNGKHNQERWEKGVESGFHPKGTGEMVKSVLVHELGHAITCNSNNNKFWSEIASIRKDYMKDVKKGDNKHPDFISGYARTNQYEFVAEAFCQGMLAKNYGKYTKQVMECIDKHFKSEYQTKLFDAKNEKADKNDIWLEEYGLGYPIDEAAFEEFNKQQEKPDKTDTAKNTIIQAINELKENNMFNKLFNKKEKAMELNKDEMKELFIDCIQDVLKAQNEAEKEEVKEEIKEEEKAENKKACNEDKRKLIDEVAGMMKSAGCDDEVIRTAIAKMEKIGYDKSEAGTANNCGKKGKNEEKEEELNAKNSIEALKGLLSQGEVQKPASKYITKSQAIELGNQLF